MEEAGSFAFGWVQGGTAAMTEEAGSFLSPRTGKGKEAGSFTVDQVLTADVEMEEAGSFTNCPLTVASLE